MYSISDQTTACSTVATTYINELIGMLMYSRVDWYVNVQSS